MNLIEASRKEWGQAFPQQAPTYNEIQTGCLQRIAAATELMAHRYLELLSEIERLKRDRNYHHERADRTDRRIVALRGVITKLKNRKTT